jgi:hypothetical protein
MTPDCCAGLDHLVQHREQFTVFHPRRAGAEESLHLRHQPLEDGGRSPDQQTAQRSAANDEELRWLIQDKRFSALHHVAAGDRPDHDERADDYQHRALPCQRTTRHLQPRG